MAIKIYRTQIRPDSKTSNVETTRDMRISQNTATQIGRSIQGLGSSATKVFASYQKAKAENDFLEKQDDILFGKKDENGNQLYEGLSTARTRISDTNKPDEVITEYDKVFNQVKQRIEPSLTNNFSKKLFNNYLTKKRIQDLQHIQPRVLNNFNNETKRLITKEIEPYKFTLASKESLQSERDIADFEINNIFNSEKFKNAFGADANKFKDQIANDIDLLKFNEDIDTDPIDALEKIKDNKNYPTLSAEQRLDLENKANKVARSFARTEINQYIIAKENGLNPDFTKEFLLKPFLAKPDEYAEYEDAITVIDIYAKTINDIKEAPYGMGQKFIDNITIDTTNTKLKLQVKQKIRTAINKKNEQINEDAAGYFVSQDEDLQILDKEIITANRDNDFEKVKTLINKRNSILEENYTNYNVPKSLQTFITKKEAENFINTFSSQENPENKIGLMMNLKEQHGDKIDNVLRFLEKNKLPDEAAFILTTNSNQFHVDILADQKQLKENMKIRFDFKTSDFQGIESTLYNKMEDFFEVVQNQSPNGDQGTEFINSLMNKMETAVHSRMVNRNESQGKAINNTVNNFLSDYKIADSGTYYIPTDVNGISVNVDVIETKAEYIKNEVKFGNYLDNIDLSRFESSDKDLKPEDNRAVIEKDIKANAEWYLNTNNDGIILAVPRSNTGKILPIIDAKTNKTIELKFTDVSATMPITNIDFDFNDLNLLEETIYNISGS